MSAVEEMPPPGSFADKLKKAVDKPVTKRKKQGDFDYSEDPGAEKIADAVMDQLQRQEKPDEVKPEVEPEPKIYRMNIKSIRPKEQEAPIPDSQAEKTENEQPKITTYPEINLDDPEVLAENLREAAEAVRSANVSSLEKVLGNLTFYDSKFKGTNPDVTNSLQKVREALGGSAKIEKQQAVETDQQKRDRIKQELQPKFTELDAGVLNLEAALQTDDLGDIETTYRGVEQKVNAFLNDWKYDDKIRSEVLSEFWNQDSGVGKRFYDAEEKYIQKRDELAKVKPETKLEEPKNPEQELREQITKEWEEGARAIYADLGYPAEKIDQLIELQRDVEVGLILKQINNG